MSEIAHASPSVAAPCPQGVGPKHWMLLLLILVLGGVLRFAWLDRPALWGDEAATWARTCGTFEQFLQRNRNDGFMPLHYELYWGMGQLWKLTPAAMRVVPAIAGWLMILAMYFLARQLLKPSAALLVAFLTSCSAYMLVYSRDAKMYMELWLFMTLHIACLLWWLRCRPDMSVRPEPRGGETRPSSMSRVPGEPGATGGLAWWSFLSSGVAMAGIHAAGWLIVPLEVIIMLTSTGRQGARRAAMRWLLFLTAIAIMAAGPVVFYRYYNLWMQKSGGLAPGAVEVVPTTNPAETVDWARSGIIWIETQMRGKSGLELARDSGSAYLYGYSRAEEFPIRGRVPIDPWVLHLVYGTLAATGIVLLAGAIRWPGPHRHVMLDDWRPWRGSLLLACWIVQPAYAFFYCRSVANPASPILWLHDIATFFAWHWCWMIPAAVAACWLTQRRRLYVEGMAWAMAAIMLLLVAVACLLCGVQWYAWLMRDCATPAVPGVLAVVAAAIAWGNCGSTTHHWLLSAARLVAMVSVVLLLCEGAWLFWDYLRMQAAASGKVAAWKSIWMPRYLAVIWPGVMLVMTIALLRLPGRVIRITCVVAFVGLNLGQYGARLIIGGEPRLDLVAHDIVLQQKSTTTRVYVADGGGNGSPGTACIQDTVGKYYIAEEAGLTCTPEQIKLRPVQSLAQFGRYTSARALADEMRRNREIGHLILWGKLRLLREDPQTILRTLGGGWAMVEQQDHPVWRHWNWQRIDTLRRIEFVRIGPDTPAPTTRPATRPARPNTAPPTPATLPATRAASPA